MARLPRGGAVAAGNTPLDGLNQAFTPKQGPGLDPNDAGGAALQQRAVDSSNRYLQTLTPENDPWGIERNAGMQSLIQAGSDPMGFSRFLQAVNERAPGGITTPSHRGDPMSGLPNAPFAASSTMWQPGQSSAVTGRPFDPSLAIQGIKKVAQ